MIIVSTCCYAFYRVFKETREAHLADHFESKFPPSYLQKEYGRTTRLENQREYTKQTVTPTKRPIPGVTRSLAASGGYPGAEYQSVKAVRGGEFIGNRMRFKVKVSNESRYTITDVRIFLISYPSESLKLDSDDDAFFSKIEPSGFRSPSFDFLPTNDCVQGEICAGVSYIDMKGQPHTLVTKPFIIRSVCDLLIPDQINPHEFSLRLRKLECGEIIVKVIDWTPEEMYEKALCIVRDANFYEVESDSIKKNEIIHAKIGGYAKGKYTQKSVAVELYISGPSGKRGASCRIKVSGEDQAMILPTIDDMRERLNAWLCPVCSSPLTLSNVEDLKAGKVVVCRFCNVTIGR